MHTVVLLALLSTHAALVGGIRLSSAAKRDTCDVTDPPGKTYSGLEYVMKGYNIFFGNALDGSLVDSGFTTYAGSQIFRMSYCDQRRSADGQYYIPDYVSLSPSVGCSLSFNSELVETSQKYTETMNTKVKVTGGFAGSSFSASVGYKTFKERTEKQKQKHISSTAECSVFFAKSEAYIRPKLTTNFEAAVASLSGPESHFDLFDNFGTHYVRSATMGARYGFTSYLTEDSWETLERRGIEVELAGSYAASFSVGGELKYEREREWAETFSREQTGRQEVTIGSKPTKGDQQAWLQQVEDNPMPIKYHIESICQLLPSQEQQAACMEAQGKYCLQRLLPRGDLETCLSPTELRDLMWEGWLQWSLWRQSGGSCVQPEGGSDRPRDGTKLLYHSDCANTENQAGTAGSLHQGDCCYWGSTCDSCPCGNEFVAAWKGCGHTSRRCKKCPADRQGIIFKRLPADEQYFVIQHKSGKCVQPHNGAYENPDNTKLVLSKRCDPTSTRLLFRMLPGPFGRFALQHHSGKCVYPYGGDDAPSRAWLVLHSECDTEQPALLASFDAI